jgi:poly(A) polymerase
MRITGDWITANPLQTVLGLLSAGGHQALLVGGCVRNALLGEPVGDIDIATDAPPLRVMDLAGRDGLRVVPTGVDHGTVTVIADGQPHEVTTFRRDVTTDGRRATVAFTSDVAEDAARRDFTMNAIYADASGQVLDPIGGIADLLARKVRFVGDPVSRISEDFLRILRFFRFYAIYGLPDDGPDNEGLAACAALSAGIETISKERIGQEMRKLLSARDPSPAVAAMQASGVLGRILPGADSRALARLVHLEGSVGIDPIRRLAAIGGQNAESALRLSRDETAHLSLLRSCIESGSGPKELAYRWGSDIAHDVLILSAALTGKALPVSMDRDILIGASAQFPVRATDLMPALQGRALGQRLSDLEGRWIASGFTLSRDGLLGA